MTRALRHHASPDTAPLHPLWFCYLSSLGWGSLCAFLFTSASAASELLGLPAALTTVAEYAAMSVPLLAVGVTALRCCQPRVGTRWVVAAILVALLAHCAVWLAPSESMLLLVTMVTYPVAFPLSWLAIGLLAGLAAQRRWPRANRAPLVGALVGGALSILWLGAGTPGEEWLPTGLSSLVAIDAGACYALIWLASLPPAPDVIARAEVAARDRASTQRV